METYKSTTGQTMTSEVKLANLLENLGYRPVDNKPDELLYLNVLGTQLRPSFSVNPTLDAWYDHEKKKGGTILDFYQVYWPELSIKEAIDKAMKLCSHVGKTLGSNKRKRAAVKLPCYKIDRISPLGFNDQLRQFLEEKDIWHQVPPIIQEVYYYFLDQKGMKKPFFASGWQNENGGWEVRCWKFYGCLGKKGMSFIEGQDQSLMIFPEINSYLLWFGRNTGLAQFPNVLILNDKCFLGSALSRAKNFSDVQLYLPDAASTEDYPIPDQIAENIQIIYYQQELCPNL